MLGALQELRAMGIGVGFASLSLLEQYPLSRIKIDRNFVGGICTDPVDAVRTDRRIALRLSDQREVPVARNVGG